MLKVLSAFFRCLVSFNDQNHQRLLEAVGNWKKERTK